MIRVLFICHGNICRSPMAEYIFNDLVRKKHLESIMYSDSAATSTEEIGNPMYPPARRILKANGIDPSGHHARQIRRSDYETYDYLIPMEQYNIRNMKRIIPEDPQVKIKRLLDFTDRPGDIDDPWYSGDFQTTYNQVLKGCEALINHILDKKD